MDLLEKINQDYITSYKNKDEFRVQVLRLLKTAIKNEEIANKGNLTDENIINALRREAKQRKDSILEYQKAQKPDMAEKEEKELQIIEEYLPQLLSEEETKKIVEDTIAELGAADSSKKGMVIGTIMGKHKNKVDGSLVAKLVNERLS